MKRFFALLLVLTLALPAAAFAEEYEMGTLTIENVMLSIDGEDAQPLGIDGRFTLGADEAGERFVADFALGVSGRDALQGTAAMEDGVLKAYLKGMSRAVAISMDESEKTPDEDVQPEDLVGEEAELVAAMQKFMQAYGEFLEKAISGELQAEMEGKQAELLKLFGETGMIRETGEVERVAVVDRVLELPRYRMDVDYADMIAVVEGLGEISPSFGAYWAAYVEYLETVAKLGGEEIKIGPETLKDLGVNVRLTGDLWLDEVSENSRMDFEIVLTQIGDEGEAIETVKIPFGVENVTDDLGTTMTMSMAVDEDDAQLDMNLYAHELNYGGYSSDQFVWSLNAVDSGEAMSMNLTGGNRTNPDGSNKFTAVFEVNAPDGKIYLNAACDGRGEASTGAYAGHATFECGARDDYNDEDHSFAAEFDLALSQADLPEGALIDPDMPTIDWNKASEEELTRLETEASTAMMSGVFSIMSTPFISDMMQKAAQQYQDDIQTEPALPAPVPDAQDAAPAAEAPQANVA